MASHSAADYDTLPYEGHPDPLIHPDRMAAVAWLHGVDAPPLENARILEIGCATGAHLIPMAYQLPSATLLGFDYSPTQIAMAEANAHSLGLNNVQFAVRDIADDHHDLREFDYIIAHGVFSWVPHTVQNALLDICRQHLSPTGVALVDYNTYPGWHLREFMRELVAFHRPASADLLSATKAATDSLHHIAEHLFAPASPFGNMVAGLQHWIHAQSPNYLAHEFGDPSCQPIAFTDFAARARNHRLEILGDAQVAHILPAKSAASLAHTLSHVAGEDYVRREQYIDFLRGRDFRRTLLVHNDIPFAREVLPNAFHRLKFSTVARHEPSPNSASFRCPDGASLQTEHAPLARALGSLCDAGPTGMTYDAMFSHAFPGAGVVATLAVNSFQSSLLEAIASGVIQPHAHSPKVVGTLTEKPTANAIARAAAASGRRVITSMLHRDWQLEEFERQLICLLDGTHDLPALESAMAHVAPKGSIANSLRWLARVGVLIA